LSTGDTVGPSRPAKPKATTSSAGRRLLFTIILVMGFVVLPICLAGSIFSVLWYLGVWSFIPNAEKQRENQPLRLEVSKDPSRTKAYRSITSALRNAEIDTVIELWDDVIEENVIIDGGNISRTKITLQAAPGKEVVWKTSRNDANIPILRLIKTPDLR